MSVVLVLIQGLLTVICAGFNSVYFWRYQRRLFLVRRKRVAATTLSGLNGGIALESGYSAALYILHRWWGLEETLLAPLPWLGARLLLLLATGLITALIIRQEWGGRR